MSARAVRGNVVAFTEGSGICVPDGVPIPGIIEDLEWALAHAKSGNAQACAIAIVIADGTDVPSASYRFSCKPYFGLKLENAINRLQRAYGRWIDNE